MSDIRIIKGKKPIWGRWWFWVLALALVIIVMPKGRRVTGSPPQNKTVPGVTYENFTKVNMGASLEEVSSLLGEGKESSSSEVEGVRTVIYTWNGPGISNVSVTIQNGIVTLKEQAGLKSMNANITLDKYYKIKEGMPYGQVKAAAGEGQITSQAKVMNTESTTYSWINSDGSSMNGTFSGGRLLAKAEYNLK